MTIEQLRNYNSSCSNCGDSQHFNTYEQICYKCGHDETKKVVTFFVPTTSGLMEFSSQQEADKFISDFSLSVSGNPYFSNN